MDWFNITSTIASVVVALAAVVTLFLVYSQLREMSKQTQELRKSINSATYQSIATNERDLWAFLSQDDEFMTNYVSGIGIKLPPGLSGKQIINIALMTGYGENLFYQFKHGALPEELWSGWAGYLKAQVNEPMFNAVWVQIKDWYWSEYVKFMESQIDSKSNKTAQ